VGVGYALSFLGSPNYTFQDIPDVDTIERAFGAAHNLIFSILVHDVLLGKTDRLDVEPSTGNRTIRLQGVIAVPEIAWVLEAFLGVVAAFLLGLMLVSARRHSGLLSDPDSLAAKMALVAESRALLQDFEGLDNSPSLDKCLERGKQYRLGQWPGCYGLGCDHGSLLSRDGDGIYRPCSPSALSVKLNEYRQHL
jgi:hypothetical protein